MFSLCYHHGCLSINFRKGKLFSFSQYLLLARVGCFYCIPSKPLPNPLGKEIPPLFQLMCKWRLQKVKWLAEYPTACLWWRRTSNPGLSDFRDSPLSAQPEQEQKGAGKNRCSNVPALSPWCELSTETRVGAVWGPFLGDADRISHCSSQEVTILSILLVTSDPMSWSFAKRS